MEVTILIRRAVAVTSTRSEPGPCKPFEKAADPTGHEISIGRKKAPENFKAANVKLTLAAVTLDVIDL
jgi:hypothetical protein